MKACLMRVNYDPRYTSPHTVRTMDSIVLAKETYGSTVSIPINQPPRSSTGESASLSTSPPPGLTQVSQHPYQPAPQDEHR